MALVKTATCVETIALGAEASDEQWHNAVKQAVVEAVAEVRQYWPRGATPRWNFSALSVTTAVLPPLPTGVQVRLLVTTVVGAEEVR